MAMFFPSQRSQIKKQERIENSMASPAIQNLLQSIENDLPRSALVQKKVPALAEGFNAERMKSALQEALFGSTESGYFILECVPAKALYLLDHDINMQYKLKILNNRTAETTPVLVNARLFRDVSTCRTYLTEKLMPIAAKMKDRLETKLFTNPVAMIEPLNMTLSAFPIDGMIPTLVDATDPDKIAGILAEALPEAVSGEFSIKDVRLLLAHYGRYKRCVLRYSIDGVQTQTQTPQNLIAYGKVDADGLGNATVSIISALRERLQEPELPYQFRIPDSLGYFPHLQLLMMEALPGKPFFKELLKTWTGNSQTHKSGNGDISSEPDMTLEQAVRTCALIAATLHSSDIKLGHPTTLELQVEKLREE